MVCTLSMRVPLLFSVLIACGVGACGGTAVRDDGGSAAGSGDTPGAAGGARSEPSPGRGGVSGVGEPGGAPSSGGASPLACPPGLPSAKEIASTPRADENLELLALRLSGGIIADQATYDRVVRDVTAVRARDPHVAAIGYFARGDGKSIGLNPNSATYQVMRSGQYQGWDCLNQTYVVTHKVLVDATLSNEASVFLTLKGIYDISAVVMQYGALPGIKAFDSGAVGGDGPTLCVTREGDLWHYVFDQAGGDCPAGCTEQVYYHYTTTGAGAVTSYGEIPANADSKYTSPEACR